MAVKFDRKTYLKVYTQEGFDFTSAKVWTIRDLDMDFNVVLTRKKPPNKAEIVVYQLSDATKNIFHSDHQAIEFYAGYSGYGITREPTLIFRGFTYNIQSFREGPDIATVIHAGDGQRQYDETRVNKTYDAGTEYKVIIEDMANLFGMPLEVDYWLIPGALLKSTTFTGRVKDVLTEILEDFFLEWTVQFNALQIRPQDTPLSTVSAVVMSPSTGLMDAEIYERQNKRRKRKLGLRGVSLLESGMFPGRPFTIKNTKPNLSGLSKLKESRLPEVVFTKNYIADTVQHIGSKTGDQFDTIVDADARETVAA